jgi:hypothetical protein
MMRPNVMMPKRTTLSRARSAVMTIQPMFSEIAPATSRTHRGTKKATAFAAHGTDEWVGGLEHFHTDRNLVSIPISSRM